MIKNVFYCLFICLGISSAIAQKGTKFPYLEGESLKHGMINIPEDVKGKYTLIGVAFSKKSENYLKLWFNPVYQQLIKPPAETDLFAMEYDINIYFIPMLTGAKRPAYKEVMKKVEKEVDKPLHPHILFFKGTLKEYKSALNISDKEKPYFYLLDENGTIVYMTSGSYSDNKLQKIIDLLPF